MPYNLNKQQTDAVLHKDGPLLIVAGAGTGKTTVITERIAHILDTKLAKSNEILAVTFTEKAAQEMEERVDKRLPYGIVDLWILTFHSFCQRILEKHGIEIGLPTNFRLLDQTQQWILIQNNFDKFDLDYYKPLGNPTKFIHALIRHFSRLKDEAISPKEYLEYAQSLKLNSDSTHFVSQILSEDEQKSLTKKEILELATQEIKKIEEVASAYHTYQELLHENDSLDFGDLINHCLTLFEKRPKILAKYRARFKYVLVDEFQDTNWAQYELIKKLVAPKNNLTSVCDDDQCLPPEAKIKTENGTKPICKIKKGDLVVSAVGKGYVSYFPVQKVLRHTKKVRFITFKTSGGNMVKVTDNHKMFCLIPTVDDKKYYYVYLMFRQNLGWRMGVTNNVSQRLHLERSADTIVGIKTCSSEQEARYYETLYSLHYNIPTVCFMERSGVAIKGEWLKRLYSEVDTHKNVKCLARDLNIHLEDFHYCLAGVNRGGKLRIKILLEMCARKYRSKHAKDGYLSNPVVVHILTLETSDKKVINILRKANYKIYKAKNNGYRLKMQSKNIEELGSVAHHLEELTGGIVETNFKIGKTYKQTRKSLVMQAKNILVGHYVPIFGNNGVVFERVVHKKVSPLQKATVFDLEIYPTHNFIANNVIVHNSIYKFRGASVSNILQFRKDYPDSKFISLITNYRSRQNILDLSYDFIQNNNPYRLEVSLEKEKGFSKKLKADLSGNAIIEHLEAETLEDEMKMVLEKMVEIKNKDSQLLWSDFAILVRANSHADMFNYGLETSGIPYHFVASRGLYNKPIVIDIISWLKLLDDYHESAALFRVMSLPMFQFTARELVHFNYWAKRKSQSLYRIIFQASTIENIQEPTVKKANKVVSLIEKYSKLVSHKTAKEIIYGFLEDSKYLNFLTDTDSVHNQNSLHYLNQFYKKVGEFEANSSFMSVKEFLRLLDLEINAGEEGALSTNPEDGPDAVKVMTIHAAKGLEFDCVFVVNLVDRRFPTTERREVIEIPDALVKEETPTGDVHLQEERRLFYVACTRAKKFLFLTSAKNYGGAREKKPSVFLAETKLQATKDSVDRKSSNLPTVISPSQLTHIDKEKVYHKVSDRFSFSALRSYASCPWQYRYSYVFQVPSKGKKHFSFGSTMHLVLQKVFQHIQNKQEASQGSLFDTAGKKAELKKVKDHITLKEILKWYEECFIDDWYDNEAQKQKYFENGKTILKEYYEDIKDTVLRPKHLEKSFSLKITDEKTKQMYSLFGRFDRVDETDKGLEIIDYKTGKAKKKLEAIDKEQLLIYQLAANSVLEKPVEKLTFQYLEGNVHQEFLGKEKDLQKVQEKIINVIHSIEKGDFHPTPGFVCKNCDYKDICPFRAK